MLDENEIKWIHWDSHIQNRLIGHGKPYLTIRILVEDIIVLQNKIREAKNIFGLYGDNVPDTWLEHNGTARGIEELGYKTYVEIQQFKTSHSRGFVYRDSKVFTFFCLQKM